MALPNYEKNIFQSGSNSKGKYLKFYDGTMLQYGAVSITPTVSRFQGGLTYYSGAQTIDLPQPFIDTNFILSSNSVIANMNYFAQSYCCPVSKSSIVISFASTGNGDTRTVQWTAIGKWK